MLFLATACGDGAAPSGAARLSVSRATLDLSVERVIVTISKGDGPEFPALVTPLTDAGGEFRGFLSDVPAGPGRQFDVVGYDASGAPIARGAGKGDILPGAVASVSVLVEPSSGAIPFTNALPVFDLLAASATEVPPGGAVTLQASARDPDLGGAVAYRWAATCGAFDDPRHPTVTWTAPASEGSCDLSLTVTDGSGGSATVNLVVLVQAAPLP